jgi:hypothetical protein
MALRFCDGFEGYTSLAALAKFWTFQSDLTSIATANPRYGSNHLAMYGLVDILYVQLDDQATWIVGFAFHATTDFTNNAIILSFWDTATTQIELRTMTGGALQVTRNGTILGTSALGVLAANQYFYIELKVTIHNSTGSYDVHVNESSVLSDSGVDTQNTANATANQVRFTGYNSYAWDLDDVYICDGTGSAPQNDFLGDSKVLAYIGNAAGDSTQFTPSAGSNYENVDDTDPDDDTTYNSSSTVSHLDLYNIPAATITGTIFGIQVSNYMRKDDAGARVVKNAIKAGTTTSYGSNESLTDTYTYYHTIWENNPDDASPFEDADIDALQLGAEIVS